MLSVTFGKYTPAHSRNIASMDIQYKVGDAPDLQSGGGTAGAADDGIFYARLKNIIFPTTFSLIEVKIVIYHKFKFRNKN